MSGNYAPLGAAGAMAYPPPAFPGLPDPNSLIGMLTNLAATPILSQYLGRGGFMAAGLGHDQNVYDYMQRQRFQTMQTQAMQQAASSDVQNYMKTFRGFMNATGQPWTPDTEKFFGSIAGGMGKVAPLLADQFGDMFDTMGGRAGSGTVLAARIGAMGRFRMDPVTGQMGMSADSVAAMSKNIMADLYSPQNIDQMGGLQAGRLGSMMQALQARGMLPSSAPSPFMSMLAQKPGDPVGSLSGREMDKLQLDPGVADKLRGLDTDKVKRTLQGYSQAIAAIRDIFGDTGQPNAPMSALMDGLEKLTMGGTSQLDPQRLAMTARMTYGLAGQAGVSLDAALGIQAHAASRLQGVGVSSMFAPQVTQQTLAFHAAYNNGLNAVPAWGALSSHAAAQQRANMVASGLSSDSINRANVLMRVRDESTSGFASGSAAEAMANAIAGGMAAFKDPVTGQMRSVNMNTRDFMGVVTGATKLTQGDVAHLLTDRTGAQEYGHKYNTARLTPFLQREELGGFIGARLQETVYRRLTAAGVPNAAAIAAGVSRTAGGQIMALDPASYQDAATRRDAIGGIIGKAFGTAGFGDVLEGMGGAGVDFVHGTVGAFWSHADRSLGERYGMNMQNTLRQTNLKTLSLADANISGAEFAGRLRGSMAAFGGGNLLSRLVDATQGVKPGDTNAIRTILGGMLGVRAADVDAKLITGISDLSAGSREIQALREQHGGATGDARTSVDAQLRARGDRLTQQAQELGSHAQGLSQYREAAKTADVEADPTSAAYRRNKIDQIAKAYGFSGGPADGSAESDKLQQLLATPGGAKAAEALLATREILSGTAKQAGMSIGDLATRYFKATGDKGSEKDVRALQDSIGVERDSRGMLTARGSQQWNQFAQSIGFQQGSGGLDYNVRSHHTGMPGSRWLGFDPSGGRSSLMAAGLDRLLGGAIETGPQTKATSDGMAGQPVRLTGVVKIDMVNKTADFSGASLEAPGYSNPG